MRTILSTPSIDWNDGVSTKLKAMFLGAPLRLAEEYGGPSVDIARLGAVDTSSLVDSSFAIEVSGHSIDEVTAVVAVFAASLRELETITVSLDGSTYVGHLVPRNASFIEIPLETLLIETYLTRIEIHIRREPWVYAPRETIVSDLGVDVPGVLNLGGQQGIAAAPLNILVSGFGLGHPAGLNLACVYAGWYPDETAVIADFVRELHALTWTGGGSQQPDAGGWPDGAPIMPPTCWKSATTVPAHTGIDVNDFLPGEYLMLCKCKTQNATSPGTIQQQFGEAVTLTNEGLEWVSLGMVTLPCSVVRGYEVSTIGLTLTGSGVGAEVLANAVAFIPCSFGGVVGWRTDEQYGADMVRWEDGVLYANDIGDSGNSRGGRVVRALGGCLVVVAAEVVPSPQTHTHMTISATPRFEQLPSHQKRN